MKLNQNNKCRETLVIKIEKNLLKYYAQINQSTLIAVKIINQKGTSSCACNKRWQGM